MANKSKIKGSAYEAKIKRYLNSHFDIEFERMPLSGSIEWSDDVEVNHYVEIKSFGCHFKVTQLDDWVKAVKEQKNL